MNSPVTFNDYGGTCGFEYPAWVKDLVDRNNRSRPAGRSLQRYQDMQEFQKSRGRPYIHLIDGGVSDNLGMRAILEGLEDLEASAAFRQASGLHRVPSANPNGIDPPESRPRKYAQSIAATIRGYRRPNGRLALGIALMKHPTAHPSKRCEADHHCAHCKRQCAGFWHSTRARADSNVLRIE